MLLLPAPPKSFPIRPSSSCGEYAMPMRGAKLCQSVGASVLGNAGIAGKHDARGRAGIHLGLLPAARMSAAGCISRARAAARPSACRSSASRFGPHPPAILREHADVFVANVERARVALLVGAGDAEQVIGEVGAGLRSLKNERSVIDRVGIDVDLIEMEAAAELERVLCRSLLRSCRSTGRCCSSGARR